MHRPSILSRPEIALLAWALLLLACGRTELDLFVSSNHSDPRDSPGCEAPLARCEQRCVDLDHDPDHCGTCDRACGEGAFCGEGSCVERCPAPLVGCERTCVDPSTSQQFCGASGNCQGERAGVVCSPEQVCEGGSCVNQPVQGCDAHLTLCDDLCIDVHSSPLHCGACNQACSADSFCHEGECTHRCPEPLIGCGGTCIDPSTSNEFCGASGDCQDEYAGVACASQEVCQAGSCLDDNALLAGLSVTGDSWPSCGENLSPTFDPNVIAYASDLVREEYSTWIRPSEARIVATPQSESATLEINGVPVSAGDHLAVALQPLTPSVINVVVTAPSGRKQQYTVAVGAAGPPAECPASCSACGSTRRSAHMAATFVEAAPSDVVMTAGASVAFVYKARAFFSGSPDTEEFSVEVSLDEAFGTVSVDKPALTFNAPGDSELVTVTVVPSGQLAFATMDIAVRLCSNPHSVSTQHPLTLTLGELPPEPSFYFYSGPRLDAEGGEIPADALPHQVVFVQTKLTNASSSERLYEIDVHLELDSGSMDDWNLSGVPTALPPTHTLAPGDNNRNVLIPLQWIAASTPPVGTTGRVISTATTTIEGSPVSKTVEIPFVVRPPMCPLDSEAR